MQKNASVQVCEHDRANLLCSFEIYPNLHRICKDISIRVFTIVQYNATSRIMKIVNEFLCLSQEVSMVLRGGGSIATKMFVQMEIVHYQILQVKVKMHTRKVCSAYLQFQVKKPIFPISNMSHNSSIRLSLQCLQFQVKNYVHWVVERNESSCLSPKTNSRKQHRLM